MRARPHLPPAARIRVGLALWLASWIPFAIIVGADGAGRILIWTVQIAVGILGLALLGTAFVATVKGVGARHALPVLWHALLHGDDAQALT